MLDQFEKNSASCLNESVLIVLICIFPFFFCLPVAVMPLINFYVIYIVLNVGNLKNLVKGVNELNLS